MRSRAQKHSEETAATGSNHSFIRFSFYLLDQLCLSPPSLPPSPVNALAKDVRIGGKSNFLSALKTAQLALKNRQNKNQRQRVIMFVGSPIECGVEDLVKLGKMFKKNNVAIDVINFGTENSSNDNTEKLEQLIAAVNTADNSHLVSIPPGPHILADLVLTSAIMQSGGGGGGGAGVAAAVSGGAAGGVSHPGGIDPSMDPEMAMAIRMSMEEERQRQQRAAGETGGAAPAASESVAVRHAACCKHANLPARLAPPPPPRSAYCDCVHFVPLFRWRRMRRLFSRRRLR